MPNDYNSLAVECIIPILPVANLAASVRYYVEVLGFQVDWGDGPDSEMASVSRDGRPLMLCQGGQGHAGTWVWIGVEDIEPLLAEFTARGAKVIQQPTNYYWAYEFRLEDPDGHMLRFGSEPKADQPFA